MKGEGKKLVFEIPEGTKTWVTLVDPTAAGSQRLRWVVRGDEVLVADLTADCPAAGYVERGQAKLV